MSDVFTPDVALLTSFKVQPPVEPPAGKKKPEAKVRVVSASAHCVQLILAPQPLPSDQKEAKIAKEVAAFSNTGWDTEEEEEEGPALPPPIVEKPVDMSKGKPIRRWDVDKESKGNLLPLVKVSRFPTVMGGAVTDEVHSLRMVWRYW